MTKEITIYNSQACDYDFEEARKDYAECADIPVEEVEDQDVWNHIYQDIEVSYEDEHYNLDKTLEGRVLAIAKVGRWNGTFSGYKILRDNLNSILWSGNCDDIKVYADKNTVRSTMYHHDGRHEVEYRMIKEDTNYDKLLDKIYNDSFTRQDVYKYTKSLRPYIREVYGV